MLFNSYLFLFIFLPLVLGIYYLCGHLHTRLAAAWVCLASLIFYGWWNPLFVLVLAASITVNYGLSTALCASAPRPKLQRVILALSVSANLGLLFYFKYLVVLLGFLDQLGWTRVGMHSVLLPLGISFFTFTQLGYLLDCKAGVVKQRSPLGYVMFVTFFPHLIAGPILHHRDMMEQLTDAKSYRFRAENIAIGGTLFVIGLAKKTLFADSIAHWSEDGFAGTAQLQFFAAWATSLSYGLQLYFDFSGYSDMALGLAKMFGIRFPLNFNSPYKSVSIIAYWQNWNMTLTRYLTEYLYNPMALTISRWRAARGLAVGRLGNATPAGFLSMIVVPTAYTMLLAGAWHGAGLNFLIFGLLHGAYLSINHAWRIYGPAWRASVLPRLAGALRHAAYVLLTLLGVLVSQAFFRATTTSGAFALLAGMTGLHGAESLAAFALPTLNGVSAAEWLRLAFGRWHHLLQIVLLFVIVWGTPNAHQILGRFSPALRVPLDRRGRWWQWRPSAGWLLLTLAVLFYVMVNLHPEARFLYFQF
jgi:alginate O-acetyltransferase complex protein AlgI